ncbi:MAG: capsule assembly Wzi family protein [Bacteroidales bacterium]|nr:capsule assembly Wzi family protein [Bacteroidales bacterium]
MSHLITSSCRGLLTGCLLTTLSPIAISAQAPETWPDSIDYHTVYYGVEAQQAVSSGDHTPFWLLNNRQGLSSIEKTNGYLRLQACKLAPRATREHPWTWGAGADIVGAYNFSSSFYVHQLYGEVGYRAFMLTVGSKEYSSPVANPRLSSGDILYSGNAIPIPQIKLWMPDYLDIPGLNHWIGVKGYISYGMFTDDNWQRDFTPFEGRRTRHVKFHSKGAFMRIGDPQRHPLWFEGGFEMAAQFGGETIWGDSVRKQPSSLKDWFKIFFPSNGGDDATSSDKKNTLGNHLGEWNASLTWRPNNDWRIRAYFEHYFEDQSMMFMEYKWKDMLLGIEIDLPKNPVVSTFVYEYLHTKDQAGPLLWDKTPNVPEQVSGADNYYNHEFYTGWQHWGMGIGNPLLISPIYNDDKILQFRHNRVIGHHWGWEGQPLTDLRYRVLLSYTRSWGTYNEPLTRIATNFNTLLELTYTPHQLKGWSATLAGATDGGSMIGHSAGLMLTIRKVGSLFTF